MANYKVAYGPKDYMGTAIQMGIIPPGCIILTEDSEEMFFYDLSRNLVEYKKKDQFDSYEEATEWIEKNDCSGQIISVHEGDKCTPYIVGYDGSISRISGTDYIVENRAPDSSLDKNYSTLTHWIDVSTETVYVLVAVRDDKAVWKSITGGSSYKFDQVIPADTWIIEHNLNCYPSVTIVDRDGVINVGELTYIDVSSLYVRFSAAISGSAYLN